nr:MAG TPA: hypothetical protein [Caudoviricetes sp.]
MFLLIYNILLMEVSQIPYQTYFIIIFFNFYN